MARSMLISSKASRGGVFWRSLLLLFGVVLGVETVLESVLVTFGCGHEDLDC